MADKLIFKRGLLANLPTTVDNGTIYMTTDEGGIYLGLADNQLKRMGDYITVANTSELVELTRQPGHKISTSALYYAIEQNVLCRWNGTAWVQINQQATLANLVGGVDVSATSTGLSVQVKDKQGNSAGTAGTVAIAGGGSVTVTKDATENKLVISGNNTVGALSAANNTITLTNKTNGGAGVAAGSVAFGAAGLSSVSTDATGKITITTNAPKVADSVSVTGNTATVTTSLNSSTGNPIQGTGDSFSIEGSGNVTVSAAGKKITIDADVVEGALTAENNKIILTNTTNGDADSATAAGEITLAGTGSLAPTLTSTGNAITVNVEAPKLSSSFNANGALNIGVSDSNGNPIANHGTSVTPLVKYGKGTTKSEAKFVNGTLELAVPTNAELDDLLKGLNAMTFKGVKSPTQINAISSAQTGDTYKIDAEGTITGAGAVKLGDLVINAGADDAAPEWQIVPSGDETVLKYKLSGTGNSITLVDQTGTMQSGSVTISGGNKITIANGAISHDATTVDTANATSGTINFIGNEAQTFAVYDTVTADAYGHVTAAKKKSYTINPIETVSATAAKNSNDIRLTMSVADSAGTSKSGHVDIASSSLALSVSGGKAVVDLEWGTF